MEYCVSENLVVLFIQILREEEVSFHETYGGKCQFIISREVSVIYL